MLSCRGRSLAVLLVGAVLLIVVIAGGMLIAATEGLPEGVPRLIRWGVGIVAVLLLTGYGWVLWRLGIGARGLAKAALHQSEERLRFALQCAEAAIWDWDLVSGRVEWDEEFCRLYGIPPTLPPSFGAWLGCVHPEDRDRVGREVREMLDRGKPRFRIEFRIVHPERGMRWLAGLGKAVYSADGKPLRLSGINLDITERKDMEFALTRAVEEGRRANLAKSKFLAAASHDLRQPIQSMMLFSATLATKLRGHPAAPLAGRIGASVEALRQLLDSLLDISKLDAGLVVPAAVPVDLAQFVRHMVADCEPKAAAKGLRVRTMCGNAVIVSDPALLRRILANLLDNAVKFTERGGVLVGCRRRGDCVRIQVIDTGIGISPQCLDSVFDEFVQLGNPGRDRTQGLGLGLATVRRMANLLGHRLAVRSRPGHGSSFSVDVPLAAAANQPLPEPAATPVPHPLPRRVLVVDDEVAILDAMRSVLEGWGQEVAVATCLDDALDRVRQGFSPDLLITDFRLTAGRTGSEVIHRLREVCDRTVPTLLLTGDMDLQAAGVPQTALLHKPIRPEDLRLAIGRMGETPPADAA